MLKGNQNNSSLIDYNTNLNNIDELINKLATPKQDMPGFDNQDPEPEPPSPEIFDPVTFSDQPKPIDPAKSKKQGLRIAKTVDHLIATGAMKVGHTDDMKRYQASQNDINDLGDAWAEYTAEKGIELPPWLALAVLNITVYLPSVLKAMNDKRLWEQQQEIDHHTDQISELQEELRKMKEKDEPQ